MRHPDDATHRNFTILREACGVGGDACNLWKLGKYDSKRSISGIVYGELQLKALCVEGNHTEYKINTIKKNPIETLGFCFHL